MNTEVLRAVKLVKTSCEHDLSKEKLMTFKEFFNTFTSMELMQIRAQILICRIDSESENISKRFELIKDQLDFAVDKRLSREVTK